MQPIMELDAAPDAELAEVVQPPSPTGFFTVIAIVIGTLVTLTFGLLLARAIFFSPDAAVRNYVEALQSRDITSAIGHLDMQGVTYRSGLLQSDVLTDETYTPPENIAITSVTTVDDHATVAGSITWTTGTSGSVVFHLTRESAAPWRVFRPWKLIDGLDYVSADWQYEGGITIAGAHFTGSNAGGTHIAQQAFPGTYLFTPGTSALVDAPTVTSVVGGQAPADVQFAPTIKQSALDDIQAQLTTSLDACAKATSLQPAGCPFSTYQGSSSATDVAWSVTATPTYVVTMNGTGTLTIATKVTGSATATWQTTDYRGRPVPGSDTEAFQFNGYARDSAGKVIVTTTS